MSRVPPLASCRQAHNGEADLGERREPRIEPFVLFHIMLNL